MSEEGPKPKQSPADGALAEAERRFFADSPELDPYDLSGLKPRPKPAVIALALAVIAACAYLLFDLRHELAYYLQGEAQALGDLDQDELRARVVARELPDDSFVALSGTPNYPPFLWRSSGGLGRGPGAGEHTRFVVFPPREGQAGSIRHIGETIELAYLPLAVMYYEDDSYPREQLRGDFQGRLIQVKSAAFLGPIREFLWKTYTIELPEDAYLLLDGDEPGDNWPYGVVSGIAVLAIGYNLLVIARQLRRGRAKAS